jgi:hypothetical protein
MMAQPATLRGTALLEDRTQVRDFGTARDLGSLHPRPSAAT